MVTQQWLPHSALRVVVWHLHIDDVSADNVNADDIMASSVSLLFLLTITLSGQHHN